MKRILTEEEMNVIEDCLWCENSEAWHKKVHPVKERIWKKLCEMHDE